MFANLKAEMARIDVNVKTLANSVGMHPKSFSNKLKGKTEFTRIEMMKIKSVFFKGLSIEYLFDDSKQESA
jgi:hypothetical protein